MAQHNKKFLRRFFQKAPASFTPLPVQNISPAMLLYQSLMTLLMVARAVWLDNTRRYEF
jgi:hypothetical protein